MNQAEAAPSRPRSPWLTAGKWGLGVALLLAAGGFLWTQRDSLAGAGSALRQPSPLLLAALLLAVLANLFFTSWLYWLLTKPYAQAKTLTLPAMGALISLAAVFNYLPLRAGLFGRVAYQKAVFGVSLTDSTKTVIQATGLSGVCAAWLVGCAVVPTTMGVASLLALPIVLGLLGGWLLPGALQRRLSWALALRQLDALVWVARYLLVFALLEREISLPGAAAVAGVGMLATFVPLTSNGLGLREWAVGLTAAVLPAGWLASQGAEGVTSIALTADLLNRAGELIVIVPAGLAALLVLRRKA